MNSATYPESQSAVSRWALWLGTLAFACQIIVGLQVGGLLLASFIPPLQPYVADDYTDLSSLMSPQNMILLLYLPLALTEVVRSLDTPFSWRTVALLARFPPATRILVALGAGIVLFDTWFISQGPEDQRLSATTAAAFAAFQAVNKLHSLRVAALLALGFCLMYMGLGYQLRWLAGRRTRRRGSVGRTRPVSGEGRPL